MRNASFDRFLCSVEGNVKNLLQERPEKPKSFRRYLTSEH